MTLDTILDYVMSRKDTLEKENIAIESNLDMFSYDSIDSSKLYSAMEANNQIIKELEAIIRLCD